MNEIIEYFDHTQYKQARPSYPPKVFEIIAKHLKCLPVKNIVDVGCGSGQASFGLLNYGEHVLGIDLSPVQIQGAREEILRRKIDPNRIDFQISGSNAIPVEDHSVDLLTVAQAIHWFDLEEFYKEAKRVLVPGGSAAIWCYDMARVMNNDTVERAFSNLHSGILKNYWTKHRELVDNGYKDLNPPFKHVERFQAILEHSTDIEGLLVYIGTWSSVHEYKKAHPDQDCCADLKKVLDACAPDTVFQLQSTIHMLLVRD
ncbi:putative methyltransferase DDB_G0268948 [Schistocerca gregaria]|uniref:putative methyltransferase DDB_G0268948 n=1 Tax=Schistocerca gregaria TaxID=7010 RepID=UPI00211EFADA|nr:putative methyltransferase DDB_G0268948 [Schistocerca gregaria]